MADKKEVLDYLRNQQKAAEIEAKVNGINLWVLLGAIGVIAWQLAGSPGNELWSSRELLLRTLVLAVAIYSIVWVVASPSEARDEVRFSRMEFDELDIPFVVLLKGLLLACPPVLLWMTAGYSIGVVGLSMVGIIFTAVGAAAVIRPFVPKEKSEGRFPKPNFGLTRKADTLFNLVLAAICIATVLEQVQAFRAAPGLWNVGFGREVALLATLYILICLAFRRRLQGESIGWTYHLETELVLGSMSPEVALRRIENRRLGPRLQDVMDRFFDELDSKLAAFERELESCKDKVQEARDIPAQYRVERLERVKTASAAAKARIVEVQKDCTEFQAYLADLRLRTVVERGGRLASILSGLDSRYKAYDDRSRSAKFELDRLLKEFE